MSTPINRKEYKLIDPIEQRSGDTIDEVQYRTVYKGKHLKKLGDISEMSGPTLHRIVCVACDLPPSTVDEMGATDIMEIVGLVTDFLFA